MNISEALKVADEGMLTGLRGMYPMAAQVLAEEVRRLRARIYLDVMEERRACIGICARYRGADGDAIASEIAARLPPNAPDKGRE